MVKWVKALAALAEELSLVLSTHIRWLTIVNYSFWRSDTSDLSGDLHSSSHVHTKTRICQFSLTPGTMVITREWGALVRMLDI